MRTAFLMIVAATSILSTAAVAQQEQGDVELGANVMFLVVPGGDFTFWMVNANFKAGYHVTDNILAGVAPVLLISGMLVSGVEGNGTSVSYGGSVFGEYSFLYLLESTVLVPYAGAQYYLRAYSYADETTVYHYIGGTLGLKYWLSETTALDMSANYDFPLNEGSGMIRMGVGFRVLLGE